MVSTRLQSLSMFLRGEGPLNGVRLTNKLTNHDTPTFQIAGKPLSPWQKRLLTANWHPAEHYACIAVQLCNLCFRLYRLQAKCTPSLAATIFNSHLPLWFESHLLYLEWYIQLCFWFSSIKQKYIWFSFKTIEPVTALMCDFGSFFCWRTNTVTFQTQNPFYKEKMKLSVQHFTDFWCWFVIAFSKILTFVFFNFVLLFWSFCSFFFINKKRDMEKKILFLQNLLPWQQADTDLNSFWVKLFCLAFLNPCSFTGTDVFKFLCPTHVPVVS